MELLDVVDENNNLIGRKEDKDFIHDNGLWHREVAVWIMNNRGEILLQKRAATKKQHPNKWALTAGHVDSGEDVLDAMIREIKEEIGIDCSKEELELILVEKHSSYKGDNNTFSYSYFYRTNKEISDFVIQTEELSELKYITIKELEDIVKKQDADYTISKLETIQDIIVYLKERMI